VDSSQHAQLRRRRRRSTSHLKHVPQDRTLREVLRRACCEMAQQMDKSQPLSKEQMEAAARLLLEKHQQPEGYLGWTMVMLASAFWQSQVAAVPYHRRLFLLPHCLKHAEGCPADYDEFGLDCRKCGACAIADFRIKAEDLGYKVLVAEGSPIVMKIIVSGYVDAIVGVACLNVLEKALDKILLAGIPCMAVPLHSSDCRNTSVDEDWVLEMVQLPYRPQQAQTQTYLHLMRAANRMFQPEQLRQLAPPLRYKEGPIPIDQKQLERLDTLAVTEALAYDFLAKGGKHSRPFITLAVYDALTGSPCTSPDGAAEAENLPEEVLRCAMSIETFHKASLVHDDIEDDDAFRYGEQTLHKKYGIPTAINVGDYLIGLGYRLVTREAASLGAQRAADILEKLAEAHMKLSEGQGTELMWRDAWQRPLAPVDALKIYALKTAPAFEAALYVGARLAGEVDGLKEPLAQFARHLGIAFQITNDLKDWLGDEDNKLQAAADVLGGRPTVLWALALEALDPQEQQQLQQYVAQASPEVVPRVRALYEKAGVFLKAVRLVEKYQQRAEAVADQVEPESLRRLLYYLVDTVVDQQLLDHFQPQTMELQPLA